MKKAVRTVASKRAIEDPNAFPSGIRLSTEPTLAATERGSVADSGGRVSCATCVAACCRLEVWCLTDTGVPGHLTRVDPAGGTLMHRLDDGWCAALDRDTLLCRIYAQRPLVCRELEVGSPECLDERRSAGIGPKPPCST
jgi:hypothetical protein